MRWRLYILLLSATAAFCFMLLTAATDYGAGGSRPTLSAILDGGLRISAPDNQAAAGAGRQDAPPPTNPADPRPNPSAPFPADDPEPTAVRRRAEREAEARRRPPVRRLEWDEDGWHREETALVTAYCPCAKCCGSFASGTTSIGADAWLPGLAADPTYLDYGTRVYVPGYGLTVVDDTGGAMRRHWRRDGFLHLDVRMTYHYEAKQWGSRYVKVRIYEK